MPDHSSQAQPSKLNATDVQSAVLVYLRRWKVSGALWTSDIAQGVKLPTDRVRRALLILERDKLVRRVADGNPTSWEIAT